MHLCGVSSPKYFRDHLLRFLSFRLHFRDGAGGVFFLLVMVCGLFFLGWRCMCVWVFFVVVLFLTLCVSLSFMHLGGLFSKMWERKKKKEHVEELCPYRNMVGNEGIKNQLLIPVFDMLDGAFQCHF